MVAADVKGEICVVIDNSGTTDLYTEETTAMGVALSCTQCEFIETASEYLISTTIVQYE